jgi:hypothetical protein
MTSKLTVNSTICGFKHKICGELDGKTVITDIETDCGKVAKIAHMEIPKKETFSIKENHAMNQAEGKCCPICIVPAAVMYVCKMELGMLSKNLAKQAGTVDIDFTEE